MRVLHIISNLGQGGAEGVLFRLTASPQRGIEHTVVSMRDDGYYGSRLRAAGVTVFTLDCPRGRLTFSAVRRLSRIIRDFHPDVVQTWMYHADLVGGVVARLTGFRHVVWGIRQSSFDRKTSSLSSRIAARLCAWSSHVVPAAIACCSHNAAQVHQQMGYARGKFRIIPNGFDLARFSVDRAAGRRLRQEWCVADGVTLIGMVARWDPQKDHRNLLEALATLRQHGIPMACVLVGAGVDRTNEVLMRTIQALGLGDCVILAGARDDVPSVMNTLDIHVLSSAYGEAFPNVVAEAMACGTRCVVTDVGDAALIVGDTGLVVPPKDSIALAGAIRRSAALDVEEQARSRIRCRARIEDNFSVIRMRAEFASLWQTCNRHR